MGILTAKEDREPFWVSYIKNRPKKNKNFLLILTGATGTGKSWSGLSICEQVDPTFTPERIVTDMKQLMELINSGSLKAGQAILWDEAGIDINARSWQSLTNKLINSLLQTFRHKRFILVFTVPYLDFVDSGTRKLFHAEFQTQSINYETKNVKVKPYLIQYNSRSKKFYYKYLRVKTKLGVAPVKSWSIPKPSQWLIDEYEIIKETFTTKLNQDILTKLNEAGDKKELTSKQREAIKLVEKWGSASKAAEQSGKSEKLIYFHLRQARKKGITPKNKPKSQENEVID